MILTRTHVAAQEMSVVCMPVPVGARDCSLFVLACAGAAVRWVVSVVYRSAALSVAFPDWNSFIHAFCPNAQMFHIKALL